MVLILITAELKAEETPIWSHEISSYDGKFSQDETLVIHGTKAGEVHIRDAETGELLYRLTGGHNNNVASMSVALSSDNLRAYSSSGSTTGTGDNFIVEWDLATQTILRRFEFGEVADHVYAVMDMDLSVDSKYLIAIGRGVHPVEQDGRAYFTIWDVETQEILYLKDGLGRICKISPDNKYAVLGGYHNSPIVFDIENLKIRGILGKEEDWHEGTTKDIDISSDSKFVVSIASDKGKEPIAKIWDIENHVLISNIPLEEGGQFEKIKFNNSNNYLLTSGGLSTYSVVTDIEKKQTIYIIDKERLGFYGVDFNEENQLLFTTFRVELYNLNPNSVPTNIINTIYPNPSSNTVSIDVQIELVENYKIEIISSEGIIIENLHNGILNTGLQTFTWNSNNYSSGVYYCRISNEDNSFSYKIIKN